MRKFIFLIMVCICLVPVASFAVYKWVDEDGVVHFSDTSPPEKKDFTEVMKEAHRLKSDDFDDGKIDGKWMVLNKENGSFDAEKIKGFLTIESKAGANIWIDGIFSPIIYQRVDAELNFTVEAKMEYGGGGGEKAGFIIFSIFSKDWITLVREENGINLVSFINSGIDKEIKKDIPAPAGSTVILKMEKKGRLLTGSFSLNGTDWNYVGDIDLKFGNYMNLGIFAASWRKTKPATAKFDYFKVY